MIVRTENQSEKDKCSAQRGLNLGPNTKKDNDALQIIATQTHSNKHLSTTTLHSRESKESQRI